MNPDTVTMERGDLENLPRFPLPTGFSLRPYRPGDRETWLAVWRDGETRSSIASEVHLREFGSDEAELARRQLFLCQGDEAVGTISAWLNPDYKDGSYGRIHWVAIRPAWQGKGLAKPMLAAALHRLKELGHAKAYLVTQSYRPVAIKLYESVGFLSVP